MKISEKISTLQAKRKLLRQLDASLLTHAAALCSVPSVEQVYRLQGFAETHFLLKNQYRFTPEMSQGCCASPIRSKSQISAAG